MVGGEFIIGAEGEGVREQHGSRTARTRGGLQSLCCGSQVLGKYLMNGHYKAKDFDSI